MGLCYRLKIMNILSVGECMAEFSPDERNGKFNLGFAGDTFNTAWYIAKNHSDVNSAFFSRHLKGFLLWVFVID